MTDRDHAATNPGGESFGSTSTGLISGLQAREPAAWSRLVHLYSPLIYTWCRRFGVQSDNLPDVVQDVFASVAGSIADFRAGGPRGSFRGWLQTITRRRVQDHFRATGGRPAAVGGTEAQDRLLDLPASSPADTDDDGRTEQAWIWRRGLTAVQAEFEDRTWQAFWRTVVDGHKPADVARDLGMTLQAVYQAKSRVMRRVRQALADVADEK